MCGIAGFIRKDSKADSDLLSTMLHTIAYRGPDHQGEYLDQNVALGHRRLKIIDLSDSANQPMISSDGQVVLIFNGEVYNFQTLREELKAKGHIFKTTSDTEVILNLYLHYGKESFSMLNGMFALGVYDKRGKEPLFYLVRDRTGIKPLFYSFKDQELVFASELKPILKAPWISKNIPKENLFLFLKHGSIPTPRTILEDVYQLDQGELLTYHRGDITKERYYQHKTKSQQFLHHQEEASLNYLDNLLRDVTKDQVVSDLPVGCFLSGGIDSSLLVSYFTEVSNQKIETFSIGYDEQEFSEAKYAKEVANFFKTNHHEIIVKPNDLFGIIENIPRYYDMPFSDPTLMPTMLLCKFAKERVAVALSGDGGDELFFGYVFQEMLYRLRMLKIVPSTLRKPFFAGLFHLLGLLFPGNIPLKIQQLRKFSEIFQFNNEEEFYQYFIGTIGPTRMDKVGRLIKDYTMVPSFYSSRLSGFDGLSDFEKIEQLFLKTFLPDTVLAKTDRASMAYSLEVRVPFLDNRVLDFSKELDHKLKYKNRQKKYLLRRLLQNKLPGELYKRKKQGFSIPLREWIRGDLNFLVKEHLSPESLKNSEHLDGIHVQKLINEHMNHRANHSHLIWSLIMFEMWRKEYL